MRVAPAGDRGTLVELADNAEVHALADVVRERWGAALEDVVPGHSSLLLIWVKAPPRNLDIDLPALTPGGGAAAERSIVRVPVVYDGPDLAAVAAAASVRVDELPAIHSAQTYRAAFIGFSPGFAYLLGGDPRLAIPRRRTPRVRVEAGSVAVASGYCAIYPSAGPGGWHILGRTELSLFDPDAARPALIEPGTDVIFEPQ